MRYASSHSIYKNTVKFISFLGKQLFCYTSVILCSSSHLRWPTADIRFFFNFIFLFILVSFYFFILIFFFLGFLFLLFSFSFHFISFHFTSIFFSFHFLSLFETKSNEMKIKSKRNQKKTTWPRADIAPKINHHDRELT